jgi:hypothetical protein
MRPDDAEAADKFTRLNAKTRREMRELTIAARQIKAKRAERVLGDETVPNAFTGAISRTHGTIVFINRALKGAPVPEALASALRPVVRDGRARLGAIHHLLAEGTPAGSGTAMDASVAGASAKIEMMRSAGAAHIEALPFLLQTLRDDLNDLAAVGSTLSGPGKTAPITDAAEPVAVES